LPSCVADDAAEPAWGNGAATWLLERVSTSCSLASECCSQRLRIHIATFNMGSKVPAALPPGMLGPPGQQQQEQQSQQVDLYVFATQVRASRRMQLVRPARQQHECCRLLSNAWGTAMQLNSLPCAVDHGSNTLYPSHPTCIYLRACLLQESGSISEWERLLAASLPMDGGYERIAWQSLRAIHLVLFASKRFRRQVLSIRGSAVATGIGNLVGNKVGASTAGSQVAAATCVAQQQQPAALEAVQPAHARHSTLHHQPAL
jgi:hypothetical protein